MMWGYDTDEVNIYREFSFKNHPISLKVMYNENRTPWAGSE